MELETCNVNYIYKTKYTVRESWKVGGGAYYVTTIMKEGWSEQRDRKNNMKSYVCKTYLFEYFFFVVVCSCTNILNS